MLQKTAETRHLSSVQAFGVQGDGAEVALTTAIANEPKIKLRDEGRFQSRTALQH
jgi:hypothetical protein